MRFVLKNRIRFIYGQNDHSWTKSPSPGFVERFRRTALDEFLCLVFQKKLYLTVKVLQKDLDDWIRYYIEEGAHQYYWNTGRRPAETVDEGNKRAPKKGPRKERKAA